jgi:hypothetical protein
VHFHPNKNVFVGDPGLAQCCVAVSAVPSPEASLRECDATAVIFHYFWVAAKAHPFTVKVISYYAYFFIDVSYVFHFVKPSKRFKNLYSLTPDLLFLYKDGKCGFGI